MRTAAAVAATLAAVACIAAARSCVAAVVVGNDGAEYGYEHARVPLADATPLDKYVAAPDAAYAWYDTNQTQYTGWGWKGRMLHLTSQKWLTEAEVGSAATWTHQLLVIVPDKIRNASAGAIWVTGGDNGDAPPSTTDEDVMVTSAMAAGAGVIAASLWQIPNQPINFASDPIHQNRTEDAVLAFGWRHYIDEINSGTAPAAADADWLPRLPMTKAVVRAMDTVAAFAAQSPLVAEAIRAGAEARGEPLDEGEPHAVTIDKFSVAGASKRGWTTWTTAAVDKRVVVQIPLVLDPLRVHDFMHSMWQSYGGWTFALNDYYALNITTMFDSPGFAALQTGVDPASYLPRYTMPTLVVDATGDEFEMPMDDAVWWKDLPEPKHRLMVQNAEHSLGEQVILVIAAVTQYVDAAFNNQAIPPFTWEMGADGTSITVNCTTKPSSVQVWSGHTLQNVRRDFREVLLQSPCNCTGCKDEGGGLCKVPIKWTSSNLAAVPGTSDLDYVAHMAVPPAGWTGFMVELEFPSKDAIRPFRFTTQVSILPQAMPFPDCHGESCRGKLL